MDQFAVETAPKDLRPVRSRLLRKRACTHRSNAAQEDCERVIVRLLLEGGLKETFHTTPYSVVSYVALGPKAAVRISVPAAAAVTVLWLSL